MPEKSRFPVAVGIDKTGNDELAAGVNDFRVRIQRFEHITTVAHFGNPVPFDQDGKHSHAPLRVARNDCAVLDDSNVFVHDSFHTVVPSFLSSRRTPSFFRLSRIRSDNAKFFSNLATPRSSIKS